MAQGADFSSWGGDVYSIISDLSPQMGSGHFPQEGYGKAAYVNQIQVIPNKPSKYNSEYSDPLPYYLKLYVDVPNCYNDIKYLDTKGSWGNYIFFGGPGNCTFQME